MQKEIWKDVKGYEGIYKVSNTGKIKSLIRNKNLIMKPNIVGAGYYAISMFKKGFKTKRMYVHIIVAIAFLNHDPKNTKLEIDHIDNDKMNNNVTNLQIVNHRYNTSKDQKRQKRSSKFVGVDWFKRNKVWRSRILINGNRKYLGTFKNEYDAHLAYQKALKELTT